MDKLENDIRRLNRGEAQMTDKAEALVPLTY